MKNRKNIIVILLFIVMVVVLTIGIYLNKNTKELKKEKIQNLISSPYTVEKLESSKSDVNIIISGDLTEDDIKDLNEKIYATALDNNIKQNEIKLEYNKGNTGNDDFYYEGLLSRAAINLKNKSMDVKSYRQLEEEAAESDKIGELSNESLEISNDGTILISFNMNIANMEDKDIASQAKTYEEIFKRENTDKDIQDVQINIKSNDGSVYTYNSSNSKILAIEKNSNI